MSWFEEQIQARKKADNEIFEDSFLRIAGSVMGKNLSLALSDERVKTKDAVDEILKYYHIKSRDIPENVQGINAVLEFLLRPSGIMFREVELTEGFRNDACGAMLTTFADDNSPVSLIPSNYIGYTYTDPVSGTKKKVDRKTEKLFSKTAYVFYKPFPMKKLKVQSILA